MHVRRREQHQLHRRDERVVVHENAGRRRGELHGTAFRRVVDDVADEVNRPAERRLDAQRAVAVIEAAIPRSVEQDLTHEVASLDDKEMANLQRKG